jgi:hypothetical protein
VEIFTPAGRGVTCVAAGQQALSYTDIHPSLGDPAVLEAMASNREGSIRVRRLNATAFAATVMSSDAAAAGAGAMGAAPSADVPSRSPAFATGGHGNGSTRTETSTPAPEMSEDRAQAEAAAPSSSEPATPIAPDEVLPDLAWVAPWQTPWRDVPATAQEAAQASGGEPSSSSPGRPSVGDMLGALRSIAQRRLQLSASRVELVLDEAAREQRPLDSVLEEIRAMSIRGVMPSTVDAMVAEMKIAAAEHRTV